MTTSRTRFHRFLAAMAISVGLSMSLTSSAWAAASGSDQMQHEWARHRQEMRKARLTKMAERLEIKSSQQGAWQTYAKTYAAMMDRNTQRPNEPADAATLVRYRASVAAEHATKLAQLADATVRLQETLTPEQRQTLTDMVRHSQHRHHDRHSGPHRWNGRPHQPEQHGTAADGIPRTAATR